MSSNAFRRSIWIIALLSLLWASVFALNLVPVLRGGAGWQWPYELPEHPERLLLFAVAVGAYVAGATWLFRKRRAAGLILWAMAACVGLTAAAQYVRVDDVPYALYTRTASPVTTGWHYTAADVDELGGVRTVLSRWPEIAVSYIGISGHVAVSPPGPTILYYAADKVLAQMPGLSGWLARPLRADQCHDFRFLGYSDAELASAWLGILMPLWGSLAVLAIYWLGRRSYSEQTARWGVSFWPLVPAFLMFAPHPSTVFPLLAAVVFGLLVEGLHRGRSAWAAASGILMSGLCYTSYSFLPLILLAGLLILGTFLFGESHERFNWRRLLETSLAFGIGLISIWGINTIVSGLFPWEVFAAMRHEHFSLDRPYLPWIFFHLNDFFTFAGWPLILSAGVGTWQTLRILRRRKSLPIGGVLTLSAAITLTTLDISGIGRGESGRVWLFLSPFFLLIAADVLSRNDFGRLAWAVVGVQAIIAVVMVGVLHVIDSELTDPPDIPPSPSELPGTEYTLSGAVFGGVFHLEAFAGHIEMLADENGIEQPTLVLWLNWQSSGQVDRPYYLSFIPVSSDDQPTQATLIQPFGGAYPTTCWLPESGLMQDRVEVPLYSDDAGGEWWVSLALVDGDTGDKLDVITPDGSLDDQVGIGPFHHLRSP